MYITEFFICHILRRYIQYVLINTVDITNTECYKKTILSNSILLTIETI